MPRGHNLARQSSLAVAAAALAFPAPVLASDAALPFPVPADETSFARALQCLTEAVYYEARSESEDGQRAVAQVVLNRVRHTAYPNSVCGVVYQGSERRTGCQFTFTCDGSITGRIDAASWARPQRIAVAALRGSVYHPVGLALNYHTTAIRPYWAPSLVRHAVIGAHIFYRRPDSGSVRAFRQSPSAIEPGGRNVAFAAPVRVRRGSNAQPAERYEAAHVEMARVERPVVERAIVERPVVERPVSSRSTRSRRAPAAAQRGRPARAAPVTGPRTTVERGVRVSRGS